MTYSSNKADDIISCITVKRNKCCFPSPIPDNLQSVTSPNIQQCISSYCAPIQCFKTCNFRYRYLHSRKVNRSADSSTSEKLENITQGNPTDYDQPYCAFHSFIPPINFSLAPKKSLLTLFEPSELTNTLEVRHLSPGCELPSEPFTVTNQHLNTTLYLLADFLQLKLDDGNLEPVFGSAFLYDVHSRQKVTETFHLM
ncbi:unnamed protein product [Heterobilharzia americana]|nr:unnamed protein product [Heterobilharzia americana]